MGNFKQRLNMSDESIRKLSEESRKTWLLSFSSSTSSELPSEPLSCPSSRRVVSTRTASSSVSSSTSSLASSSDGSGASGSATLSTPKQSERKTTIDYGQVLKLEISSKLYSLIIM